MANGDYEYHREQKDGKILELYKDPNVQMVKQINLPPPMTTGEMVVLAGGVIALGAAAAYYAATRAREKIIHTLSQSLPGDPTIDAPPPKSDKSKK